MLSDRSHKLVSRFDSQKCVILNSINHLSYFSTLFICTSVRDLDPHRFINMELVHLLLSKKQSRGEMGVKENWKRKGNAEVCVITV